jgi:hypothetical protein
MKTKFGKNDYHCIVLHTTIKIIIRTTFCPSLMHLAAGLDLNTVSKSIFCPRKLLEIVSVNWTYTPKLSYKYLEVESTAVFNIPFHSSS